MSVILGDLLLFLLSCRVLHRDRARGSKPAQLTRGALVSARTALTSRPGRGPVFVCQVLDFGTVKSDATPARPQLPGKIPAPPPISTNDSPRAIRTTSLPVLCAILSAKKAPPKRGLSFVMKGGWVRPAEPYFETNSHAPSSRYPTLAALLSISIEKIPARCDSHPTSILLQPRNGCRLSGMPRAWARRCSPVATAATIWRCSRALPRGTNHRQLMWVDAAKLGSDRAPSLVLE